MSIFLFLNILLLVIDIIIIVLVTLLVISVRTEAPFVPTQKEVLPDLKKVFNLQPGEVVYDLGCGNAQVIGYLAKLYPDCQFVGSDINHLPIWWGRWRFRKLPNLTLKREDLFTTDISKADKVFVYLFPRVVTALLPRFKQELKPGSKVISLDFPITDYEPTEVIDLTDRHFRLSKHIYIYQF